jgi:hypothetical protein
VDPPALRPGPGQELGQPGQGLRELHADLRGHFPEGRLRPRPDEILEGQVVAVDRVRALIEIHDGREAGGIEAEKIEERAVLAETIGVVRVVHRTLLVPQEEDESAPDLRPQSIPPRHIKALIEHVDSFPSGGLW